MDKEVDDVEETEGSWTPLPFRLPSPRPGVSSSGDEWGRGRSQSTGPTETERKPTKTVLFFFL